MPKIPRDISAKELLKLLKKYGYQLAREKGSHIRLAAEIKGRKHNITIPNHNQIKIGTLNNILKDIGSYLGMSKNDLVKELFGK